VQGGEDGDLHSQFLKAFDMKPRRTTGGRRDQKMKHVTMDAESEVMTVPEVATYLRCHASTIYRLVKGGDLQAFRLGSDWRFFRSDINKWITDRHVQLFEPITSARQGRDKRPRKPKG
jgi:excisionase family DNA binding protein